MAAVTTGAAIDMTRQLIIKRLYCLTQQFYFLEWTLNKHRRIQQ
jgi:hypothetical protein